jgi:hypothetical protein
MLRKAIWFFIILFVGYIWFSQVMQSCGGGDTKEAMSNLDANIEDEDAIFQADEDSGDDGYIISDENDTSIDSNEYAEENTKENPSDVEDEDLAFVADGMDEDDFVEKSPELTKKTISREVISETTYSSEENADFLVIAGSFSNEVNADRMVQKLKDMGYSEAEKIVFDFSQYYSVVSGKHDSEATAKEMSIELKNKNINAYVHKMRSKFFGD